MPVCRYAGMPVCRYAGMPVSPACMPFTKMSIPIIVIDLLHIYRYLL